MKRLLGDQDYLYESLPAYIQAFTSELRDIL
jgi:hypothetical protein